jgi:hypothetical protein
MYMDLYIRIAYECMRRRVLHAEAAARVRVRVRVRV